VRRLVGAEGYKRFCVRNENYGKMADLYLPIGTVSRGAEKFLAFPSSYFHICSTTKEVFLDWLKKLEQRCHKCVEFRGNM
jgi:hypothetical protein